jgi:hypothetical protein
MTFTEALKTPLGEIPENQLFAAVVAIGAYKLDIRKQSTGFLIDGEYRTFFRLCNQRIAELLEEEDRRDKDRREKAKAERERR